MMQKIPVKIIQVTALGGDTKKGAALDFAQYFSMNEESRRKIKEFEREYFGMVNKATELFYGPNPDKKRSSRPSTTFWKLGKLFDRFHENTSRFYITNYANALERDFGLTGPYIRDMMAFSREFKKSEVSDNVPMAIYRELIRKRNQLYKHGLFEKEKQRLIDKGKAKQYIGREDYKKELKELLEKAKKPQLKARK